MKKPLHISLSVLLLAVVLFAAIPKYYVHQLLGHHHGVAGRQSEQAAVTKDEGSSDCNFEKFDTPVYYTVFKFIVNFIPFRPSEDISFAGDTEHAHQVSKVITSLRGPPIC